MWLNIKDIYGKELLVKEQSINFIVEDETKQYKIYLIDSFNSYSVISKEEYAKLKNKLIDEEQTQDSDEICVIDKTTKLNLQQEKQVVKQLLEDLKAKKYIKINEKLIRQIFALDGLYALIESDNETYNWLKKRKVYSALNDCKSFLEKKQTIPMQYIKHLCNAIGDL